MHKKEKPGIRYTFVRSLSQVSKWVRLKFAAMNFKILPFILLNGGLALGLVVIDVGL